MLSVGGKWGSARGWVTNFIRPRGVSRDLICDLAGGGGARWNSTGAGVAGGVVETSGAGVVTRCRLLFGFGVTALGALLGVGTLFLLRVVYRD